MEIEKKNRAQEFGEVIKKFRKFQKYTQKEISEKSGVKIKTISKLEKGEKVYVNDFFNVVDTLKIFPELNRMLDRADIIIESGKNFDEFIQNNK